MEQKDKPETNQEFYTPPPVVAPSGPEAPPTEIAEIETKRREAELLGTIQFLLEPAIPEAYKEEFKKWEMLISRTLAVSNISEDDVYRALDYFDLIILWLKFNKPDIAVKRACRLLMELQLRRSVHGFERMAQISTRQTVESLQLAAEKKKRRGWAIFR